MLWVLLSSLLFATMGLLVKLASAEFSLVEIMFFRALPGSLVLYAYARSRGLSIRTPHWRIHAVRNAVGIASMGLGFYAISKLALATATTLEYTAPIFMVVYLAVIGHHRPSRLELGALAFGFGGVALLLQPSFAEEQALPFLAALASGAVAPIAYLQIRRLGNRREPAWRTVFFYSATVSVLSAIALPFTKVTVASAAGLVTLLGVGATGAAAQLAMTRAYSAGSPTLTGVLQYSTVLFAAAYGYVVWDDSMTLVSGLGLALIIGSGAVAAYLTRARVE